MGRCRPVSRHFRSGDVEGSWVLALLEVWRRRRGRVLLYIRALAIVLWNVQSSTYLLLVVHYKSDRGPVQELLVADSHLKRTGILEAAQASWRIADSCVVEGETSKTQAALHSLDGP